MANNDTPTAHIAELLEHISNVSVDPGIALDTGLFDVSRGE